MTGSDQVAAWGSPTFDVWVTRRDFAQHDPRTVQAFVAVTLAAQARWRREGAGWTAQSPQIAEVVGITGSRPRDVLALLASNYYPTAAQQASSTLLGGGLAQDLADTAAFLKAQGKIDQVLPSYAPYLSASLCAPGGGGEWDLNHGQFWRSTMVSVTFAGRRGPVRALDKVSVEVSSGEVVVALGASGCGKSTLLGLMAGFEKPTTGTVQVDGRTISGPGQRPRGGVSGRCADALAKARSTMSPSG